MYVTNPLEGNAYGGIPPAKPTPQWKELQTARQRIGLMLVAHAKAQPQALLPHLADLANKTQELWAAGVIGTNEQSTLFDVVLAAASGADLQLQKQVAKYICKPMTASVCDANLQWIAVACDSKAYGYCKLGFGLYWGPLSVYAYTPCPATVD